MRAFLALALLSSVALGAVTVGQFAVRPPSATASSTVTTAGNNNGPLGSIPNNWPNNNNSPNNFGSNNNGNDHNNNDNNSNNSYLSNTRRQEDEVINDHNRFRINDIVGTWALGASGETEVSMIDHEGYIDEHPWYKQKSAKTDVDLSFVGLLCIDRRGKCSLELLVSTAEESFIRESFGDDNCQVNLIGDGQGFIKATLTSTCGCDQRQAFPSTLILNFVLGENGEGFFTVSGCPFGLEEHPKKHYETAELAAAAHDDDDTRKGKFQCKMADHDEGGNGLESSQIPIQMSGEMERQNARQRNQNQQKHDDHNNGPWGNLGNIGNNDNSGHDNSGYSNSGYSNYDNGMNRNNDNNDNNNQRGYDDLNSMRNRQDKCERFTAFTTAFALRPSNKSPAGYVPGCAHKCKWHCGEYDHEGGDWSDT
jgi:hypothetical protein